MTTGLLQRLASLVMFAGLAMNADAQASRDPGGGPKDDFGGGPIILPTPPSEEVDVAVDSGLLTADPALGNDQVVFVTMLHVADAPWLRLQFEDVVLGGDPANDNASRLRITSLRDGAVQWLTSESVLQWKNTSAYFNGDAVTIELIASPGTGQNRLLMTRITAGLDRFADRTICGSVDDRALSYDDRNARHSVGCSSWLINDLNTMFLTAGHCGTAAGNVMSFKVPLSTGSGGLVNPGPEHQYVVDGTSVQFLNNGVGQDFGYFGVNVNSNTGLTPHQAYGMRYTLATSIPAVAGSNIRITGYGTTSAPVSPTWNQVQKTHLGPMKSNAGTAVGYATDTTGGNSGSVVFHENTGKAIGVHTHGGCTTSSSSYNNGTAITFSTLQAALTSPAGVCKTGKGTPGGELFVSGDAANNFGTASRTTGAFAKVSDIPGVSQGMAWDWNRGLFYVIDNTRKLYTMTAGGTRSLIGTVTGTTSVINGLAFDPASHTLYGVAGSNGQLFKINRDTLAVSTVGAPGGGNVGGLDFDSSTGTLYGVSDISGGTRLIVINTTSGAQTIIGALGTGITDCNGLAYVASTNELFTINAGNEQMLRITKASGIATVIGATNGLFGASFAMAGGSPKPCPSDFDGSGFSDFEDYDAFVAVFEAGLIDADVDGSGFVDFEDFNTFVAAFELGC